jgi:hypothetical protein
MRKAIAEQTHQQREKEKGRERVTKRQGERVR